MVLMSGDVHHTVLRKLERKSSYPLHELTCSPLTAGAFNPGPDARDTLMQVGTLVGERNFCLLRFEGTRKDRKLVMQSANSEGKVMWRRETSARELQTLRAP